jgi:hypothetical protein
VPCARVLLPCLRLQVKKSATKKPASAKKATPKPSAKKATPKPKSTTKKAAAKKATPKSAKKA